MDVRFGLLRKLSAEELVLLKCGVGEASWESLGPQGDSPSPSYGKSVLNVHSRDWCWSWNSNTLATWCEEPTHWKSPWWWERLKAGGEGVDRGWDGWMASPTQWTWVWVRSRSWWWTGKPGVLQSMGHKELDMTVSLNWTDALFCKVLEIIPLESYNFPCCLNDEIVTSLHPFTSLEDLSVTPAPPPWAPPENSSDMLVAILFPYQPLVCLFSRGVLWDVRFDVVMTETSGWVNIL